MKLSQFRMWMGEGGGSDFQAFYIDVINVKILDCGGP